MIDEGSQYSEESVASENDAADLADVQASWLRAWEAQKEQFSKAKSLASAEISLCFKAIILSALCVLLLVGVALLTWATILLSAGYAAHVAGIHWAVIAIAAIVLNLMLFWIVGRIFINAKRSISLQTTLDAIFKSKDSSSKKQSS
ncbi:hypothetical protein [Aliiglaciecola lipolytica]|uniref:Phage holin family protein n=1 Tax=Aliiglaciecola lipolytica E3 TaxID=1127673 RepID=K6YBY7_9ALTE|nr:hypothetical protein [Aliiglaciecola lipolytica]GAC15717.1 hypothetical protein GLIP_3096 [Aliiglaciecola lipolytica E3]